MEREAIVDSYNDGLSAATIAELAGCNASYIHRILREEGVQLRQPRRYRGSVDLPTAQVVAEYEAGATLAQLAEKYDCSDFTVRQRLMRAHVSMRKPGPRAGR